MKIAVYHNLPSGGAKRALYEWTRRLADSHTIDVYTLSTADHAFCDIRPFVRGYHISSFAPRKSFESPWGRLNRLQRWRDLGELTRIGRHIAFKMNKGGYDVVFANPCPYTNIPILVRFLQIPSVYYLHEPFGPAFERQFNRPYLKTNTRWRELSKRLDPFHVLYAGRLQSTRIASVKQTTRLLANSRYTQQHMEQHYGADAPVCYYGVDIEGFSPIAGMEKENCVLSVGELTPRKGFGFLIESLEHLPPDERPALRLGCNWVDPDEKRYIEGVAARAKVELQIQTNLTTPQLTLEYNRALLCVYSPIAEPLGLVPLESMACGTPVVGVAEGGVRETVRHNETGLLTRRNAHSFAEAVKTLISDPARREQMAHQGRLHVEKHWRWDRSVLELERHLASAAQS